MPRKKAASPLLDESQAAFLGGPVAINMASRDARGYPSLTRGFGCRVSPDLLEVVVYVARRQAEPLLRDLAAGAPVAVVFSRPLTHQTLQLKGERARLRHLQAGERESMQAAGDAFTAEIMSLGYPGHFSHALMSACADEATAVVFTPTAVFEQTPGPKAGIRLEPKP